MKADAHLTAAINTLADRAHSRDHDDGERSMARTVDAFNAIYGTSLSEEQGWQFMVLLKMVHGQAGTYRADDYTDEAGYSALAGEAACKERGKPLSGAALCAERGAHRYFISSESRPKCNDCGADVIDDPVLRKFIR